MNKVIIGCFVLAAVLLGTGSVGGQSIKPSDIDTVRANIIRYLTGEGADRGDSLVAASIRSLEWNARAYIRALTDSGWQPAVIYNQPLFYVNGWSAFSHYLRLNILALAYRTQGQAFYLSDSCRIAFEKATRFIENKVFADMVDSATLRAAYPAVSNWWYPYQGIPQFYGPALLLMQGAMDTALFNHARATVSWCINYWRVWELQARGMYEPSGDRITQSLGELCFGVLSRDTVRFRIAYRKADTTIGVIPSYYDGIKPDFMLHHHRVASTQSNVLHTGSYGAQVAEDGPKYFHYTRNTGMAPSSESRAVLTRYMADGVAWCIYGNHWDLSVVGRSVTRVGNNAQSGFCGMIDMAMVPGPRQAELQAGVKKLLETWKGALPVPSAASVGAVKRSAASSASPRGHRHFFWSDYTIHRRPGYFMSVKMVSTRIKPAEYVNTEGRKSWHLSDGLTYLVRSGDEYFGRNVLPTLDWNRLPGITVQKKPYTTGLYPNAGTRTFTGGVQSGAYGVSTMDFAASEAVVTAKKSWFFFENEITCLGADIDCPSADTVETIVDQRRLSAITAPTTVNGTPVSADTGWRRSLDRCRWIHNDSIGYFFFDSVGVNAMRITQNGRWSDIGTGDTSLRSNPIFTLLFNHGAHALNKSYAYTVLPNLGVSAMAAYASNPAVRLIANNDSLQAVENSALKATGAVFWKAGRCGKVTADTACTMFWQWKGDTIAFAASFPPHRKRTLLIGIDSPLTTLSLDSGVTVSTPGRSTQVRIAASDGKTYTVLLRAGGSAGDQAKEARTAPLSFLVSPNPFNPKTTVRFNLPVECAVSLAVYDLRGRFVRTLIDGKMAGGNHTVTFDGHNDKGELIGNGVYIFYFEAGNQNHVMRITLDK